MKLRITFITIVAAAAALLVFAACTSTEIVEKKENALYTVRIGDLDVTGIPEPIEHLDWEDEEYEVAVATYETIVVKEASTQKKPDGSTLVADKVIVATANEGARITWGLAKGGARPSGVFKDTREAVTFELDDYLYIRVTSADPDTKIVTSNYYRFSPYMASPVRELSNITVAGREPTEQEVGGNKFTIPTPSTNFETLALTDVRNAARRGRIDITNAEKPEALIEAETKDLTAKIRYAYADSYQESAAGNYTEFEEAEVVVKIDPNDESKSSTVQVVQRDFQDGNIIYVEVTAQDDTKNYYAFQVWAGRMATIATLKFNDVLAAGKGVQHANWDNVAKGAFATADQTDGKGTYTIDIALDDPEGDYGWVKIASPTAAAPAGTAYGKTAPLTFEKGETLAIRVESALRQGVDVRYYKIEMDLQATDFTAHPKSAVYNVASHTLQPGANGRIEINAAGTVTLKEGTVTPLTFTTGKSGSFEYQWYEANSWYGGYGFDRDGRIYGDEGYGSDVTGATDAEKKAIKDLLGTGLNLDEKNNVSLHNGGNNYYRLVTPGRPIPNATGTSYTPVIDASKRPFIGGYSTQTHYYWVVVTDRSTRLTAISDRAAIITEWGHEWDLGKEGKEVTKKHHIVDLHAYQTPGAVGLQESPKNINPFTFKREVRRIPITFPDDFNVKDYSVAIVQAKFYLGDGKEWIQNWTQGDIGFGKEASEGEEPEQDVIYYNLTNNNATLGLDGDAKEPQGGSLGFKPTHIVVKPAGEKPPKQMPPFEDNATWESLDTILKRPLPKNIDDAQGWFTPYIELVEVRFEGPPRP